METKTHLNPRKLGLAFDAYKIWTMTAQEKLEHRQKEDAELAERVKNDPYERTAAELSNKLPSCTPGYTENKPRFFSIKD